MPSITDRSPNCQNSHSRNSKIYTIRRRQIIDAAERLAARTGWTETTIADICQEADVSSGVVTRYFHSKDEIMFAALEDVLAQLHIDLQLLMRNDTSLPHKLGDFLQILSRMAVTKKDLHLLLIHFIASSIHRADVAERLHAFFSELRQQHIERAEQFRDHIHGEPALFVGLVHSMALCIVLCQSFLALDLPPDQLATQLTQMLLKYFDVPHEPAPEAN